MAHDPRAYANTSCPYCSAPLDPLPKARKRCPSCGQPIYVRSGPDGLRYLLQEVDLPVLEQAWSDDAELRRDPANPGDPDAVQVVVRERLIGYLPDDVAGAWSHYLTIVASPVHVAAEVQGHHGRGYAEPVYHVQLRMPDRPPS